jgi:hypothetical protein
VIVGLVAGIVPGFIAIAAVAVAAPIATTMRAGPRAALDESARIAAPRRWTVLGIALAIVAVEIAAVVLARFGLPAIHKKSPPADFVTIVRYAWVVGAAGAIVAPIGAIVLVVLGDRLQRDAPPG